MEHDPPQRYASIAYLFGAYLNQDYDIYGASVGDAVRALARDEDASVTLSLRADIARFLHEQRGREDAALDAIERDRAHPPGLGARDYLRWIDSVLADSVQGHAAE